MPTHYDKEFKQNIINLYKQGESAAQLAREYGIGYSTVHYKLGLAEQAAGLEDLTATYSLEPKAGCAGIP